MVTCAADDGNWSENLEAELAGSAPGHELDMNGEGLDVNGEERQGPGLVLSLPIIWGGWGCLVGLIDT